MNISYLRSLVFALTACLLQFASQAAEPPRMGTEAPDFVLKTLDNQPVCLSDLTAEGKVVLVVLRGWPGYMERRKPITNASASPAALPGH